MSRELEAMKKTNFNWVRALDSIWTDTPAAIGGSNIELASEIIETMMLETTPTGRTPGRIVVGSAGIGKTHLVAQLRRKTWEAGGWFVLLDVIGITDFWKSAALSFLTSLTQEMPNGQCQYEAVICGVARIFKIETMVRALLNDPDTTPKKLIDVANMVLMQGLMKIGKNSAGRNQDVFRTLWLLKSQDPAVFGLAYNWLQGFESDATIRGNLGISAPPPSAVDLVRGMAWIMGLAGSTMVAVDQIDGVVQPKGATKSTNDLDDSASFAETLASGLLQLYDVLPRGQTIITCLEDSWNAIKDTLASAPDRFRPYPDLLRGMDRAAAVQDMIASRLHPAYAAVDFTPNFPTWPFSIKSIEIASAGAMTPRSILMRCDAFRRQCLNDGVISICDRLPSLDLAVEPSPSATNGFDRILANPTKIEIDNLFDRKNEDKIAFLLRDTFGLYTLQIEISDDYDVVSEGDQAQKTPPLHGRLTFTYHLENDSQRHFCFRAVEQENAIAFQARLRAALTSSGISNNMPDRQLLVVRRNDVPGGAKTKQLVDALLKAGGKIIRPTKEDLRTFITLRAMRDKAASDGQQEKFERWLIRTKPLCETNFFKTAGLCPPPILAPSRASFSMAPVTGVKKNPPDPGSAVAEVSEPKIQDAALMSSVATPSTNKDPAGIPIETPRVLSVAASESIHVGIMASSGSSIDLPISVLPRHTAILAGAGSGKTVLLRRLVEEAAIAGIPSIVIDPNNDLSRMGDIWPSLPETFNDQDEMKTRAYRDKVEVVVWTPGIHSGNPLFLRVLPDFAAIGPSLDERRQAVLMAVETLAPLAGLGPKNNLKRGVLTQIVTQFASHDGSELIDLIALLVDLPEGVSDIDGADEIARKMANQIKGSIANNPLLQSTGPVLDAKLLFFGTNPGKVRISVINLSGLPTDEAKQDFVNRLQMTLFGWIKKNPSPRGLLYVIDEAQNFVPSTSPALSKTSGVQLVAQARKYGLGMILATQAPKGIDNKIIANCTTQFLGKQNSPATINAAKEMIAASGGHAEDLGKLKTGEFYFKTDGSRKPEKIKTPICLSWHPANPPTPDEVIERARNSSDLAHVRE